MSDEVNEKVNDEHNETAIEMLRVLLSNGGSPIDMIDTMAHLNGMVACGLAFSVKGNEKPRRKAYQVQTDITLATRKSIAGQHSASFAVLSFEDMFSFGGSANDEPAVESEEAAKH